MLLSYSSKSAGSTGGKYYFNNQLAQKVFRAHRYIVFYNGTSKREPIEKLKLSDAFMTEDSSHKFEWTTTMIILNKGKNEELLSKCKPLSDYMPLINKINRYKKMEMTLKSAVERASINQLSDEELQAIYKEITGKEIEE